MKRLTPLVVCLAAAAVVAVPALAADAPAAPLKVRLFYDGSDDPVGIAFSTDKPIETQRTNPGLRAGAGVLNTTGSVSHLVKGSSCYTTRASDEIVRKLTLGHRYQVTIKIATASQQETYHRTLTLRKVRSVKSVARELDCG